MIACSLLGLNSPACLVYRQVEVDSESGAALPVFNPANGEQITSVTLSTAKARGLIFATDPRHIILELSCLLAEQDIGRAVNTHVCLY